MNIQRVKPAPLTDEQEARIQIQIANDPDAPEATDDQLEKAQSFLHAFPDLAAKIKNSRGRPKIKEPKEVVTLRLSPSTIKSYKALGKNWRSEMAKQLEIKKPS